jgi:hypothetical protein
MDGLEELLKEVYVSGERYGGMGKIRIEEETQLVSTE